MTTSSPGSRSQPIVPPPPGGLRRAAARVAALVPPLRAHLERDRLRARELADASRALHLALGDRDAHAAAIAARAGDAPGALPIGDDVVLRPQRQLTPEERSVVDAFHDLYYTRWRDGLDTINVTCSASGP